jgi:hypothetical protein
MKTANDAVTPALTSHQRDVLQVLRSYPSIRDCEPARIAYDLATNPSLWKFLDISEESGALVITAATGEFERLETLATTWKAHYISVDGDEVEIWWA